MDHQTKQKEVINEIENQVSNNALNFSLVAPVQDYENDPRICLTNVHIPHTSLLEKIQREIINPLKEIAPDYYYYTNDSLHMTVKNIRVINDPPHFSSIDISKAEKVIGEVIPAHHKFEVYFYRLLLFPNNLALVGTTDPELDEIVLDLDRKLKEAGVADDKQYTNSRYFFSNMTLARFPNASNQFINKVNELSNNISFEPYTVDSVTLLTCNAAFKKRTIINTWELK